MTTTTPRWAENNLAYARMVHEANPTAATHEALQRAEDALDDARQAAEQREARA